MIKSKIVSSLEKCFPDENIGKFVAIKKLSALRGESIMFQLAFTETDTSLWHRAWAKVAVTGELAERATIRRVEEIPSAMPVYPGKHDDNFLRTTPGLYPDLLAPLHMMGQIAIVSGQTRCVWIEIETDGCEAGVYDTAVSIIGGEGNLLCEEHIDIKILNVDIPSQKLRVTQWFHCDCLAQYYNIPVFSERHWEIIENFIRTAVRNGINTILTPVFTPPLDTAVGHERLTVQLIDVDVTDDGYVFGFERLDRWIDMCDRCGVENFEVSHLFTQWGATHAPKVVANVGGEVKRIFGWETDSIGDEYRTFIRAFLTEFISHMKARGDDTRCIYHISDEPNSMHIEAYEKAVSSVRDLIDNYKTIDALSNIEYYKNGLIKTPVPSNNYIEPFLEYGVPHLWTYYCCGQSVGVSNRFFAMPSARTRFMGIQMYKYNIEGFLQWGYNFYNNQGSFDAVNPYTDSTGDMFVPSGDAYSVYPAQDGSALESLRIRVFFQGLQDMRALELCASLYGKDTVIAEIEKLCGKIVFDRCLKSSIEMEAVRERINEMIEAKI